MQLLSADDMESYTRNNYGYIQGADYRKVQ